MSGNSGLGDVIANRKRRLRRLKIREELEQ
jgi:hypothetical protein